MLKYRKLNVEENEKRQLHDKKRLKKQQWNCKKYKSYYK